jgi:rhodanese-related sulfurtransferase
MTNISPQELSTWLADTARSRPLLLDVREPWEWEVCHLPESTHAPMRSIPARVNELDRAAPIVVICHHGGRSAQVGQFLAYQGFAEIYNLIGGVDKWAQTIDPAMPRY